MAPVQLRRAAVPKPKPGFGSDPPRAGGICNTDIELLRGYYGFRGRPGHEFVGEVVGPAGSAWLGKRVVGEINLPCGACEWCARGLGRHCPARTVLGIVRHPGAFAEFLTLPESNLHEVPRHVSDEHAVFTEPIAAACEILDQVKIAKGSEVAVLGDGKARVAGGTGAGVPGRLSSSLWPPSGETAHRGTRRLRNQRQRKTARRAIRFHGGSDRRGRRFEFRHFDDPSARHRDHEDDRSRARPAEHGAGRRERDLRWLARAADDSSRRFAC
jgi:hypothetical protein